MSRYTVTETRRTRTTNTYGASGSRSTFGYWVPLVLTVTAATVGIAAWIWSERKDDEEDSSYGEHNPGGVPPPGYTNMSGGLPPGPGPAGHSGPPPPPWQSQQIQMTGGFQQGPPPGGYVQGEQRSYQQETRESSSRTAAVERTEDAGFMTRVGQAVGINRAPSPGQAYGWASKGLAAGVAAAGAAAGAVFGSEKKDGFDETERWSEEAESRDNVKQGIKRRGTADEYYSPAAIATRSVTVSEMKRKTVAIVVSSVQHTDDGDYQMDAGSHASILAHLPEVAQYETTRIFVLIYAPSMTTHPLTAAGIGGANESGRRPSQSMASSFSNISTTEAHTPAQTPGEYPGSDPLAQVDPQPVADAVSPLYKTLHNQALALVDRDTMIMPFTSISSHKHMLRSIQPEVVYIQESLCGDDGEIVADLTGWIGQTVVVIGDEGGFGGLVDTDDEMAARKESKKSTSGPVWWKREERTGLGRKTHVVEAIKIGDDWRRRVNGED